MNNEIPKITSGRSSDIGREFTRLAAEAETRGREMAAESEQRAAEARLEGHEVTASLHDMFAQGEHAAGEQASKEILARGAGDNQPPEATS